MDRKLLDIIACPICKGELEYNKEQQTLICHKDKLAYPVRNGIPVLLESEAKAIE